MKFCDYFFTDSPSIRTVNTKEAITEMYPRIPWEVAVDTLGSAEHIFRTTELPECKIIPHKKQIPLQPLNKTPITPLYGHKELATVLTGCCNLTSSRDRLTYSKPS